MPGLMILWLEEEELRAELMNAYYSSAAKATSRGKGDDVADSATRNREAGVSELHVELHNLIRSLSDTPGTKRRAVGDDTVTAESVEERDATILQAVVDTICPAKGKQALSPARYWQLLTLLAKAGTKAYSEEFATSFMNDPAIRKIIAQGFKSEILAVGEYYQGELPNLEAVKAMDLEELSRKLSPMQEQAKELVPNLVAFHNAQIYSDAAKSTAARVARQLAKKSAEFDLSASSDDESRSRLAAELDSLIQNSAKEQQKLVMLDRHIVNAIDVAVKSHFKSRVITPRSVVLALVLNLNGLTNTAYERLSKILGALSKTEAYRLAKHFKQRERDLGAGQPAAHSTIAVLEKYSLVLFVDNFNPHDVQGEDKRFMLVHSMPMMIGVVEKMNDDENLQRPVRPKIDLNELVPLLQDGLQLPDDLNTLQDLRPQECSLFDRAKFFKIVEGRFFNPAFHAQKLHCDLAYNVRLRRISRDDSGPAV